MGDMKRRSLQANGYGGVGMYEDKDGPYVLFTDYERVVAELREAHEKALAEAERRGHLAGKHEGYAEGYDASLAKPRTLTADDPEPGVGSVVLGRYEISGQRVMDDDEETPIWRFSDGGRFYEWATVQRMYGPVALIWNGGDDAPVR